MTTLEITAVEPLLETVEIAAINRDVQVRMRTDPATVDDYYRALNQEPAATFPPVVCFRDRKTGTLFLADGNHRLESRLKNDESTIDAEVRLGGRREALAYALGSSKGHGLRFSNADKRKAATLALEDAKLKKMSDNQIAALIGVSQPFISKLRARSITVISEALGDTADVGNIGTKPAVSSEADLERVLQRFTKLLSEVTEANRASFADKVMELLTTEGRTQC